MNLMIADDNPVMRSMLGSIVGGMKTLTISVAKNGLEVLDLYDQNHYDIIIIDDDMPKMSGIKVLQELRDDFYKNNTYVIFIPTEMDESLLEMIKRERLKVDDIVKKPINVDRLKSKLNDISSKIINAKKNGSVLKEGIKETLYADIINDDDIVILVLKGEFTNHNRAIFSNAMKRIENISASKLIINLDYVNEIDDYGYGSLMVTSGWMDAIKKETFIYCNNEIDDYIKSLKIYNVVPKIGKRISGE